MPTNAQLFAGPSKDLYTDNLVQLAKTHRNIDIAKKFNANRRDGDKIHVSTIGARLCRGLEEIAERTGRTRQAVKEELENERKRNGVAGRNQHTAKRAASEIEEDDEAVASPEPEAKKATPPRKSRKLNSGRASGDAAGSPAPAMAKTRATRQAAKTQQKQQRADSVAGYATTASPLAEKSKGKQPAVAAPGAAAVGKKRDRAAAADGGAAESQDAGPPAKKPKTDTAAPASSAAAQGSRAAATSKATPSQRRKSSGAAGSGGPPSSSPSSAGKGPVTPPTRPAHPAPSDTSSSPSPSPAVAALLASLDAAETHTAFAGDAFIDDDYVLQQAGRQTVGEIVRAANGEAGGRQRHSPGRVARRISIAVERMAQRQERSPRAVLAHLDGERAKHGVRPGGGRRLSWAERRGS